MSSILVDLDGVVLDYAFPKAIKKHFGATVTLDKVTSYSIQDVLGISTAQLQVMFEGACSQEWNYTKDAKATLQRLAKAHKIYLYTDKWNFMGYSSLRARLLDEGIPFERVYKKRNLPYKLSHEIDYYIDDRPTDLLDTILPNVKAKLLFDQPWNRACLDINHTFTRVHSWKEIEELING